MPGDCPIVWTATLHVGAWLACTCTDATVAVLETWSIVCHSHSRIKLLSRAFVDDLYINLMGDYRRQGLITTGLFPLLDFLRFVRAPFQSATQQTCTVTVTEMCVQACWLFCGHCTRVVACLPSGLGGASTCARKRAPMAYRRRGRPGFMAAIGQRRRSLCMRRGIITTPCTQTPTSTSCGRGTTGKKKTPYTIAWNVPVS